MATRREKKLARFHAIAGGLVSSWPSHEARRQHEPSTAYPEHYLNVTYGQPYVPPPTPRRYVPPDLLQLASLQDKKGRFQLNRGLFHCLGDNVPKPPEAFSDWRWATALAVAHIERFPKHWPEMEPVVELAMNWIPDRGVLDIAKAALPPPLDYDLEAEAVESGKWKDATYDVFKTKGYRALKARPGVRRAAFDRTEARFTTVKEKKAPTLDAMGIAKKDGDTSSSSSESEPEIPPDTPTWKRQAIESERELDRKRKAEKKKLRKERKARVDLLKELEADKTTASTHHKRFLDTQRAGLEVEWAVVQDTGERPFQRGEPVDVFIRRDFRWTAPKVVKVPQPAVISRANADGTVDVTYTTGACEREYRVERRHFRRRGEGGYDPGKGGWGLKRTPAEGLRDRWLADASPPRIAEERKQLEDVKATYTSRPPFSVPIPRQQHDIVKARERRKEIIKDEKLAGRRTRVDFKALARTEALSKLQESIMNDTMRSLADVTTRRASAGAGDGTRTAFGVTGMDLARTASASALRDSPAGSLRPSASTAPSPRPKTRADRIAYAQAGTGLQGLPPLLSVPPPQDPKLASAESTVALRIAMYEMRLKEVKEAAIAGSQTWRFANAIEAKQNAFVPLTKALQKQRVVAIAVCDAVAKWQLLKQEAEDAESKAANTGRDDDLFGASPGTPGNRAKTTTSVSRSLFDEKPPLRPFIWNGSNVLTKMIHVLDYLGNSKELVAWYSKNYPFQANPLAVHTPLEGRPATPVKTTRRVLLAGKEVEQEVESLVKKNREQRIALRKWGAALNATPAWWPCNDLKGHDGDSDDDDVMEARRAVYAVRRALKVLEGEAAREKERAERESHHMAKLSGLRGMTVF